MVTPSYITVCTRKAVLSPGVYEFAFKKPAELSFRAGQFLLFDVPLLDNPTDIQPRAYSIASSPDEAELLFVIKLKEGGRASLWFEHQLDEGSEVRMQGPFGVFTVSPDSEGQIVLIGTGTGIAPYRSHLHWLLKAKKYKAPLALLFGARHEEDLFWMKEFQALAAEYPSFHFCPTLTAPKEGWKGKTGRVQTIIPTLLTDPKHARVYVCGAPEMVTDVKEFCMSQLGMPKQAVHAEGYV